MKKKLLISWGNPYIFYEVILPLIPKLSEKFSVSLILGSSFLPEKLRQALDELASKKMIDNLWVLPDHREILKHHLFIKKHLPVWHRHSFNLFLSISGIEIIDRYLIECVLDKACQRVCFWTALGYLLQNEKIARKLLGETKTAHKPGKISEQKLFNKIKKRGLSWFLRTGSFYVKSLPAKFAKDFRYNYLDRVILPFLMVKKAFPLNFREKLVRVSANKIDALVFCDELEAKAFAAFYPGIQTIVAQYPTQGSCRCNGSRLQKPAVLVPLTTGISGADQLSADLLTVIYRDIRTVLRETGADTVHLRLHPRESAGWPKHLADYLKSKGIKAECVSSREPIKDIICDYAGMTGFASSSLKDARAACDNAIVVGFSAISKKFTSDPKLWFGRSEGIGWIEEDGSFDPEIFKRKKFIPPPRKSLDEILVELADRSK